MGKSKSSALVDTAVIYCGDNLEELSKLPDNCVDLIYIDPPFNSNAVYEVFWGETQETRSFTDRHESPQDYIGVMRPRCEQLARVLKPTGSFYYHCDWHASHYIKVMLDVVFGEGNFQNDIAWKRTHSHGDSRRHFANLTDHLLFYTKTEKHIFNLQRQPYTQEYVDKYYKHVDKNGRRYQLVTLRSPHPRKNMTYDYKGYKPHANGWAVCLENMKKLDAQGRLHFPKDPDGAIREIYYLDEMHGVVVGDNWTDIPPISAKAAERLGYPTQKPLALLERIINASSNKGDVVLDAFCGCGTALVAAENLGRQWIGIDISPTACNVMAKRMRRVCHLQQGEVLWENGRGFVVRDLPWTIERLRKIPPFEFENWAVLAIGGTPNTAHVGDKGIDGRVYLVSHMPTKKARGLAFMDNWYPIQVKQKDKVGRPEIQQFEAAMHGAERPKGIFVSFGYTSEAITEIQRFFEKEHRVIVPLTVQEILDKNIGPKLA